MRFGSCCSGIEAASVAFGLLGWEAAWLAEVDPGACAVLAHRLGATAPVYPLEGSEKSLKRIAFGDRLTNWGDMTRLPGLIESGEAEAPDLLVGGPPCQAFSIAGKREGLNDARGNLTLAFVLIADAIDRKRIFNGQQPCVVFFENVPGILSDKTNAFGCLLAGLAGEDVPLEPPGGRWTNAGAVLGPERAVAWRILDAQHFGVPQRRNRVFVVASAREGFDPAAVLFEFDGVRRDSAPSREAGEGFTHDVAPSLTSSGRGVERSGDIRGQDPVVAVRTGPVTPPQWWDGSPVSQTLDAVLHKGQTMPEKNRFPAVLQPVSFDLAQVTAPRNRQNRQPGDPMHTLAQGQHKSSGDPVAVMDAIPILEAGARTGVSTTDIRAGIGIGEPGDPMFTLQSGKQHAVAVSLRGREGGGTIELGDEVAGTLRASGGGDKPHVLAVVHGTQDPILQDDLALPLGRNNGAENAVCV